MKSIHLVLIGTIVLISGDLFDTATTTIALLNPIYAGQFVEAGDPFIRLLMYDMGLATAGFLIGIVISFVFDALMIYAAYSASHSFRYAGSLPAILFIMTLFGVGHWIAGYENWLLLMSVGT